MKNPDDINIGVFLIFARPKSDMFGKTQPNRTISIQNRPESSFSKNTKSTNYQNWVANQHFIKTISKTIWADISGYLFKSSFGRASLSPGFPFYPGRSHPVAVNQVTQHPNIDDGWTAKQFWFERLEPELWPVKCNNSTFPDSFQVNHLSQI